MVEGTISPNRSRLPDVLVGTFAWGTALIIVGMFLWLLAGIVPRGLGQLTWGFLTGIPEDAGRAGGIGPIIVSTAWILAVCMTVALPLGLGTAILLAEFSSTDEWLGRVVRRSLDVLAGTPSIVFGLFGSALFCRWLGMGFSILSGGLTLACMVLPILIRATEEGFRSVPDEIRLGAAALGLSRTRTIFSLLLPTALPGLVAGFILGIGRAVAETAALLFTSGYVYRMPGSLLDSGRSLSVHIYDLSMNVPGGDANACATAVLLIAALLVINTAVAGITGRWRRSFGCIGV